jgi:epoxyqueuosine reductase
MNAGGGAANRALQDEVLALAANAGFALAGIADARPSDHAEHVRAWIADGRHGSMDWLANDLEIRLDPRRMLRGARSVLCVADRYAGPRPDRRSDAATEWPPRGRVARYARGDDYHIVLRKRLRRLAAMLRERFPDERFRIACDLLPVLERELAARAGIGKVGKHTIVLRPGEGSYLLLGEVLMTLDIAEDSRARAKETLDPCGTCTRCIDACPTNAISPFSVDARRCIAYTSIEHRGTIPDDIADATGDWIFGCDICQEVCPHNQPSRRSKRLPVLEVYRERRSELDLLAILGWTEADRQAMFVKSALRRAFLPMWKRNALIALGNALAARRDPAIERRIAEIAADPNEDDVVRSTAADVLRRLARSP